MVKEQERTRPGVAAPERAGGIGAVCRRATDSVSQCTTKGAARQRISSLLGRGPGNGVTLRALAALTGWPERDIRLAIRAERLAGVAILSDNRNGYFLPGDPAEAQRFARSMRRRAAEINQTATAVGQAAGLSHQSGRQLEGQGVIF